MILNFVCFLSLIIHELGLGDKGIEKNLTWNQILLITYVYLELLCSSVTIREEWINIKVPAKSLSLHIQSVLFWKPFHYEGWRRGYEEYCSVCFSEE